MIKRSYNFARIALLNAYPKLKGHPSQFSHSLNPFQISWWLFREDQRVKTRVEKNDDDDRTLSFESHQQRRRLRRRRRRKLQGWKQIQLNAKLANNILKALKLEANSASPSALLLNNKSFTKSNYRFERCFFKWATPVVTLIKALRS